MNELHVRVPAGPCALGPAVGARAAARPRSTVAVRAAWGGTGDAAP